MGNKTYFIGTHRERFPVETWKILEPHLRSFGITRIADVTGLDCLGIPVTMAVRPLALTLAVSQGKGHTLDEARVSAAMEAIELACAERLVSIDIKSKPAHKLGLPYCIDDLDHQPGSPTDDETVLDWTGSYSLLTGKNCYLPHRIVALDHTTRPSRRPAGLRPSSNGLAGGNSVEESQLHALYEVLERDAIEGIADTPVHHRKYVSPDSVRGSTAEVISRISERGATVEIVLVPNRWGLPCFVCYLWDSSLPILATGSGLHSSPDVALSRAITEAAQTRLTVIAGSRDDLPNFAYEKFPNRVRNPLCVQPKLQFVGWESVLEQYSTYTSFTTTESELAKIAEMIYITSGMEPIVTVVAFVAKSFAVSKAVVPRARFGLRHGIPRPVHVSTLNKI